MRYNLAAISLLTICCAGLAGCGHSQIKQRTVDALPLEAKLDLIEAENDLFIAYDAVDEASTRVLETRDDYHHADLRIKEAKEALRQAQSARDSKLIEVGQLSVQESRQRKDFLDAWLDVQWAALDVQKVKLELARARYERTKAQVVKKANVEGAQKISLKDFDRQVADLEESVKKETERSAKRNAEAEKVRSTWYGTRKILAEKTGGGQGSPWVE